MSSAFFKKVGQRPHQMTSKASHTRIYPVGQRPHLLTSKASHARIHITLQQVGLEPHQRTVSVKGQGPAWVSGGWVEAC